MLYFMLLLLHLQQLLILLLLYDLSIAFISYYFIYLIHVMVNITIIKFIVVINI